MSCRLYLDGKVLGTKQEINLASNAEQLFIGAFHQDNLFFKGKIDELRIWQSARNQQEITENMHLTAYSKTANPLAYYQFNQSSGNTLVDVAASADAAVHGDPTFASSNVNVGGTGSSQTISNIAAPGTHDFTNAKLKMEFTSIADTSGFTISYQTFKPNTTDGVGFLTNAVFNNPTWTVIQDSNAAFSANLTFTFPAGTFSSLVPFSYRLYHRDIGSDGPWSLLVVGASSVTSTKIAFDGVGVAGQFMVAKE